MVKAELKRFELTHEHFYSQVLDRVCNCVCLREAKEFLVKEIYLEKRESTEREEYVFKREQGLLHDEDKK